MSRIPLIKIRVALHCPTQEAVKSYAKLQNVMSMVLVNCPVNLSSSIIPY